MFCGLVALTKCMSVSMRVISFLLRGGCAGEAWTEPVDEQRTAPSWLDWCSSTLSSSLRWLSAAESSSQSLLTKKNV
jgi:hypothetical protein